MCWVSDIILLCDLEELYPESGEERDEAPAVVGLNAWLEGHGWTPLVDIKDYIGTHSEKAFQACAYGAALNFLDVPAFLNAASSQSWENPDAVLLLLKNEEEERFSTYRMSGGTLSPQAG